MSSELQAHLETLKELIERNLIACLPEPTLHTRTLVAAMHHAVVGGGKRLRPMLCLEAAKIAGGSYDNAIFPACAVELLHSYTLVHDDLPCMDNDLVRRGQPTVHAKYGEAVGVLAGDALLSLAFETLARTPENKPGLVRCLVKELAAASGAMGVIGGQVADITAGNGVGRATVEYVFRHKTALLFRAAMRMGAITAGASEEILESLTSFAESVGMAFQITDDLLDKDTRRSGKTKELSCLHVMSEEEARVWASQRTEEALVALQALEGDQKPLKALAMMMLQRQF